MRGVYPARGQDSSVGGGTGNNCLGVVHMEAVQVGVQVEVQEKSKMKERHTEKDKAMKQRRTNAQSLIMDGMEMR